MTSRISKTSSEGHLFPAAENCSFLVPRGFFAVSTKFTDCSDCRGTELRPAGIRA